MRFGIKTFSLNFKVKDNVDLQNIKLVNKMTALFVFILVLSLFFKIYSSNLFVIEAKKVDELKYRLKIAESELKKIKKELAIFDDKEKLLELSKKLEEEDKIDVVLVRE